MGGVDSNPSLSSGMSATRKGRVTMEHLEGTWYVDAQKVVIENSKANVYKRVLDQWVQAEIIHIKDEQLHFQFKDHILSKGRLRATSAELMFRNGEDVRIWTRQNPFSKNEFMCPDIGGESLSLRHPSDMGANKPTASQSEQCGDILPYDSYEEKLHAPDDSAEEIHELPAFGIGVDARTNEFNHGLILKIVLPSRDDTTYLSFSDSNSSNASFASDCSSSDMCDASWLDEGFFTEI